MGWFGKASSVTDIEKEIYNKTMQEITNEGNKANVTQRTEFNDTTVILDCNDEEKENGAVFNIANYNDIDVSVINAAAAKAFADVVIEIENKISDDIKTDTFSKINVEKYDHTTIQQAMESYLNNVCNDSTINQEISVNRSFFETNTCGEFNFENKNSQALACTNNAMSDMVSKLQADLKTTAETKTGTDYTTLYIVIAIIVIIVIIIVVVIIFFTMKNKTKFVKRIVNK